MKFTVEITKGDARFSIECINALLRSSKGDPVIVNGSRQSVEALRDRLECAIKEAD